MPSPFPGMDPWLESPTVWPDFHDRLAEEISASLNRYLPSHYYAQLGVREELGIIGQATTRRIVPDVGITRSSTASSKALVASSESVLVLDEPRSIISESLQLDLHNETQPLNYVEIRDARSGHDVVTLIEILSPANKASGPDHDSYVRKRNEILGSTTSLIEIDLLRAGRRDFFGREVHQRMYEFDPPLDYFVFVQRAWQRNGRIRYQLFPIRLQDTLPVIAIPLRESEQEVSLDLQFAFQQTYDRGPYGRGAVNYDLPPAPALSEELSVWSKYLVAIWRS